MFQFTEDCIVGVEQIDAEHQYLISLMNQMMEVLNREEEVDKKKHELEAYIQKLIEYGETHFYCVKGIENLFLVFLHILVVCKRKSLHNGEKCGE